MEKYYGIAALVLGGLFLLSEFLGLNKRIPVNSVWEALYSKTRALIFRKAKEELAKQEEPKQ
jgi:hypothetical protein